MTRFSLSTLTPRFGVIAAMIALAALTRFLPHPPNATAVAAMALFAGAQFASLRAALFVPFAAMLLSDAVIGFDGGRLPVYGCFAATVLLGRVLRVHRHIGLALGMSLVASVMFFIVTNFFVWLAGTMYPMTQEGLAMCFAAALPYFHNTVLGDMFFTCMLFGGFELVKQMYPETVRG